MAVLKGFREFILRGSVIDLAVGVAVGAAFTAVITAFGNGVITPLVRLFSGGRGVEAGALEVKDGVVFDYALVINALITFVITAAAIYFLIVLPVNRLRRLRSSEPPPDTPQKQCTECLSSIPEAARRCPFCTSTQDVPVTA